MVMSDASLATEVPSPIESPTCAALSAGASLVPSPVTATTWSSRWSDSTSRFLSIGRARAITLSPITRSSTSSSVRAAKSLPVMMLCSPSSSLQRWICRPISRAVAGVSPVTIFTSMPAPRHSSTASLTSSLTGSLIATMPWKVSPSRVTPSPCSGMGASRTLYAKPSVRIAWLW